jgi:hypothetical protein
MNHLISIYSAGGVRVHSFGRKGGAPGELVDPIALATTREGLVVWDADPLRTFTFYDSVGRVTNTMPGQVRGDWNASMSRPSLPLLEDPYQGPREDLTRRLKTVPDDVAAGFLSLPDDRLLGEHNSSNSKAVLLKYSAGTTELDTIAMFAPPLLVAAGTTPSGSPLFDHAVFSARPVWVFGPDWIALGSGDSTIVRVLHDDGDELLIVKSVVGGQPIIEEQLLDWGTHVYNIMNTRNADRPWFRQWTQRQYSRIAIDMTSFAAVSPTYVDAFANSSCLIITGFSPTDDLHGSSHTLHIINVRSHEYVGAVRIPLPLARIRDVSGTAVYTTERDSSDVFHVKRWPLPQSIRC